MSLLIDWIDDKKIEHLCGSSPTASQPCSGSGGLQNRSALRLESLTKLVDETQADQGTGQLEQGVMSIQPPLETNAQLAEAGQPRMSTLDNPTMSPQFLAAFNAATSNASQDAATFEMFAATSEVIAFICV